MTTRRKAKVSTDMRKLKRLLKEIPEERQPIATGLYNELVFMQNTMERLKQQIEDEKPVDMFKQGKQEFLREHPALKAYNTTVQRFSLLYKQLVDLLPPTEAQQKHDELMDFITGENKE